MSPPGGEGIGPGMIGPGFGFPGGDSFGSGLSDSQASSGLVEVSIYGVVTLYERYETPKTEGDAAAPAPAPTEKPTPPAPAQATPMDATPAAPKNDGAPTEKPKQ
jgi:hypothetical protein